MAKILINCLDYIGDSMAGPAIRSWEFSRQLSKNHKVVLLAPKVSNTKKTNFELKEYSASLFAIEMRDADILITQKITPKIAKLARRNNTKIILDAYDPISIEALEYNKNEEVGLRVALNKILLMEQGLSLSFADSIVCASEKQRDLWIGALSALGRITPGSYDKDPSLRTLLDVVPFGITSDKMSENGRQRINKMFSIKDDDFVLLWGGGIWNWFDPLSLIKAVEIAGKKVPLKLIFMGLDHPNENIPRMAMAAEAIKLSKKTGLYDKDVFFNEGWVAYDQRADFLSRADVGVSMHFDHLETRFSFRTRILDYLWAGLPIITTRGDSFAELVEEKNLGRAVPYENPEAIAVAIVEMYDNPKKYQHFASNSESVASDFHWEKCVEPINTMIETLINQPVKSSGATASVYLGLIQLYRTQKIVAKKLTKKVLRIES